MKFETYENQFGKQVIVKIDADGKTWGLPADPANADYAQYLRWLENPNGEEFTGETL